jgi:hypothetical protein
MRLFSDGKTSLPGRQSKISSFLTSKGAIRSGLQIAQNVFSVSFQKS